MASISFTNKQLLLETAKATPLHLSEGTKVVFSDIFLPDSTDFNPQIVIQGLGQALRKEKACLSTIQPDAIHVEKVAPLSLQILKPLSLFSANHANWLRAPFNRIGYRNISTIHDLDVIPKGNTIVSMFQTPYSSLSHEEIEKISYRGHGEVNRTFLDMLLKTHTDGIVILQHGKLVYERYFDGQDPDTPHIQFSNTKSLTGIIVAQLIQEEIINPNLCISNYIPELEGTAFADARVTDVLDMTTGIQFTEEYADPNSEMVRHFVAASFISEPPGYQGEKTIREFLKTLKKDGNHNETFHYVSANTEVLSWLVEKATELSGNKKTVSELFHELIWSKLGTEHDALMIKDRAGDATWCGGFTATTRDMTRIGQMILDNGKFENEQLISPQAFEFMRQRDTRQQFIASGSDKLWPAKKDWSYANQFWWTNNEHGAFTAIGISGQLLYIDPKTNMVLAKNSSHTDARGDWLKYDSFVAIHALSKHLLAKFEEASHHANG